MLTPTICSGNRQAKSGGTDCLAIIRRDLVAPAAQAFLILSIRARCGHLL
jgi:hypothetical protein